MSKRKNTRMTPREDRRSDTAARAAADAAMTPEERDLLTIATYGHLPVVIDRDDLVRTFAELWLGLADEPDPTREESELARALARQYRRIVGYMLTRDEAHAIIDHDDRQEEF